jgi:hypothetical protein
MGLFFKAKCIECMKNKVRYNDKWNICIECYIAKSNTQHLVSTLQFGGDEISQNEGNKIVTEILRRIIEKVDK